MKGFVIVPQPYDRLPEYLLEVSPGFAESPEYLALDEELRSIPGLVVSAWGGYLRRVVSAQADDARRDERDLLRRLCDVLESLCSSEDVNVVNAVQVEIFEHLHEDDDWHARFRSVLGPVARNVYDDTMRPDPDWSSSKA